MVDEYREIKRAYAEWIVEYGLDGLRLSSKPPLRSDVIGLQYRRALISHRCNAVELQKCDECTGSRDDTECQDCNQAQALNGTWRRRKRQQPVECGRNGNVQPGAAREADEKRKTEIAQHEQRPERTDRGARKDLVSQIQDCWNEKRAEYVRVLECTRCTIKAGQAFGTWNKSEIADDAERRCDESCQEIGIEEQLGISLRCKRHEAGKGKCRKVEVK